MFVIECLSNRQEAEDIAQEAFVRAYINIHTFDQKRKFSTWLFRIATNLCIDRIRKKNRIITLMRMFLEQKGLQCIRKLRRPVNFRKRKLNEWKHRNEFNMKLVRLSDKYRSVIILRYIEEFPLQEISDILELPLGNRKDSGSPRASSLKKTNG